MHFIFIYKTISISCRGFFSPLFCRRLWTEQRPWSDLGGDQHPSEASAGSWAPAAQDGQTESYYPPGGVSGGGGGGPGPLWHAHPSPYLCPPALFPSSPPSYAPVFWASAACSIFRLHANHKNAAAKPPADVDITSYSCLRLGFPLLVGCCWPWMSLDMTNTLMHTCHFHPPRPAPPPAPLQPSKKMKEGQQGEKNPQGGEEK